MITLDKNIRKSSTAPVWNWGDRSVQFFKEKCFTSTAYQLQNSHDGVTAYVYGRLKNTERKYPKHKLKIIPWSENWQRNNMNKLWKSLWSSTDDNSSGWYVRNLACNARMVISMESVTSEIVSSVCWSKKKTRNRVPYLKNIVFPVSIQTSNAASEYEHRTKHQLPLFYYSKKD